MDNPKWEEIWGPSERQRVEEKELDQIALAAGFVVQSPQSPWEDPTDVMVNWNNYEAKSQEEIINRLEAAKAVIILNDLTAQSQADGYSGDEAKG